MGRIICMLMIIALLGLTGCSPSAQEKDVKQEFVQLQQEKDQLAAQVEDLNRELRKLKTSHELYILVTEDIDKRLARAEGRTGP